MLNDWSHKVWAIFKRYCPGNIKKYCPPCHKARGKHDFILATKSPVWIIIHYIFSQGIYRDNGRIYQIKIYKKILKPNYGCVGATHEFTCSDTVFTSLVIQLESCNVFLYVDNRTTISLNSFMT